MGGLEHMRLFWSSVIFVLFGIVSYTEIISASTTVRKSMLTVDDETSASLFQMVIDKDLSLDQVDELDKVAYRSENPNFRSLYFRMPNLRMSSLPIITINNFTISACADSCVRESRFECKSFDIDNKMKECRLYNQSHDDPYIHLVPSTYVDHYRTAYDKLFHRLPNHIVTLSHDRKIPGISAEACARRCIYELSFKCQGFDYEVQLKNCWLTRKAPQDTDGVIIQYGTDYYQRIFDGPFDNFINFGYGTLRPLEGIHIYNKIMLGVSLEHCAQLCLAETGFSCSSFDYLFTDKSCHMSQYIAANVHGLHNEYSEDSRAVHYEIKDEYLNRFYPTPYAAIVGHNEKTISRITPSNCARKCLLERDFICRSFDYQIWDGKCLLSSKAGSDVGGLSSYGHAQVHHFEMKPSLDCGGNLTNTNGDISSPNWPRNYPHNLNCSLTITVAKFKVIRLTIVHFNLSHITSRPCDVVNDRLVLSEDYRHQSSSLCIQHDVDNYISKTNSITLDFITNSKYDSTGFKIFYNDDWSCGGILVEDNGEFASPRWPNSYPSLESCEWKIKAPQQCKIYLIFTSVDLEDQIKGECSKAYDRLEIFDSRNSTISQTSYICGTRSQISHTSSENVFIVKFISDERVQKKGFHAVYKFMCPETTTLPSTETNIITTIVEETSTQGLQRGKENISTYQTTENVLSVLNSTILNLNNTTSITNATISHTNTTTPLPITKGSTSTEKLFTINNSTHLSLFAMFVEPSLRQKEQDNHVPDQLYIVNATTETVNIAVTQLDKDLTSGNIRLWHTIVVLIVLFVVIVIVTVVLLCILCRHYRNKLPKRRPLSNECCTEESETLYNSETKNIDLSDKGSFESLTQSSPLDPQPDVTFTNPVYDRRNVTSSSSTLASSTFTEYTV